MPRKNPEAKSKSIIRREAVIHNRDNPLHNLECTIMRKVCPQARWDENFGQWHIHHGEGGFLQQPVGLENVLQAFPNDGINSLVVTDSGWMWIMGDEKEEMTPRHQWKLGQGLRDQAEDVLLFLYSLIVR